jgi:phage terminase small subunit
MAKVKKTYDGSTPLRSVLQEAFINNLLQGMNQADAYKAAGYRSKTPKSQANQLMTVSDRVMARLSYKRSQLAKRSDVTAERVVNELAKIGFADLKDFLDTGNEVKDLTELDSRLTAAVESVQTDIRHDSGNSDGYTEKVKIKLHNKIAALDKLAQHLGLYEADNTQKRLIMPVMVVTFLEATAKEQAKQIESKIIDDPQ